MKRRRNNNNNNNGIRYENGLNTTKSNILLCVSFVKREINARFDSDVDDNDDIDDIDHQSHL